MTGKTQPGAWPKIREELAELEAALAEGDAGSPPSTRSWATCCSRWSMWPVTSGSIPEPRSVEASAKFRRRFQAMEALADERGPGVTTSFGKRSRPPAADCNLPGFATELPFQHQQQESQEHQT